MEVAADARGHLGDLFGRPEVVEARHQRVAERRGDGSLGGRATPRAAGASALPLVVHQVEFVDESDKVVAALVNGPHQRHQGHVVALGVELRFEPGERDGQNYFLIILSSSRYTVISMPGYTK